MSFREEINLRREHGRLRCSCPAGSGRTAQSPRDPAACRGAPSEFPSGGRGPELRRQGPSGPCAGRPCPSLGRGSAHRLAIDEGVSPGDPVAGHWGSGVLRSPHFTFGVGLEP